MSWISGLAKGAEELLNKVDQSAASALHKQDAVTIDTSQRIGELESIVTGPSTPFLSVVPPPPPPVDFTSGVVSTPVLNKSADSPKQGRVSRTPTSSTKGSSKRLDTDEQLLFEFLNSDETVAPAKKLPQIQPQVNGHHSRKSSGSSVSSYKSGNMDLGNLSLGM